MTTFETIISAVCELLCFGFVGYMISEIIKEAIAYAHAKEEDKKDKLGGLRCTCIVTCVDLIFLINMVVVLYHAALNK